MFSEANSLYELWLNKATADKDLIKELKSISSDENEIYERFYKELEFGTAGLRGIIGAGTNRMNVYTVGKTTQGLANYLNSKYENPSVAISYDSRIKANVFAKECASVLAANGITAYITRSLQPVPLLSFCVRDLNCSAGIMITASHNPAEYNGYKCYGPDGCQMTDSDAGCVYDQITNVDIFEDVKRVDFQDGLKKGLIKYIDCSIYDKYLSNVQAQSINPDICSDSDLKVVYTPLNGTGNKFVRKTLGNIGIKKVVVVPEQERPDGNFPTCKYPNPEFKEALELALKLAEKENPDLILATDPDCDRVGIAVKDGDNFRLMTGNETGILLLNYILSCRAKNGNLPQNPIAIKTIVSSPMIDKICENYNCELRNVLTGFKYIGEQILGLEKSNETNRFIFGFEESYGYLVGSYVRDKDAVVASMLICEMAAYYKKQDKTLIQVIEELYEEYGYYLSKTLNFAFEGAAGMEKMTALMDDLRENPPEIIADFIVVNMADYLTSEAFDIENYSSKRINLPKSNVLEYGLEDGLKVIIRPSGTEPKIKVYITCVGETQEDAKEKLDSISEFMNDLINNSNN